MGCDFMPKQGWEILRDQMSKFAEYHNSNLLISDIWDAFESSLKCRNRFFPDDSFTEKLGSLLGYTETLTEGTVLYRARVMSPDDYRLMKLGYPSEKISGISGLPSKRMGPPPDGVASSGRANPAGISYLYLASDPATACAEVRGELTQVISVSRFKLTKNAEILDLQKATLGDVSIQVRKFYKRIAFEFSVPRSQKDDAQYIASQYIAAYFQNANLDGIGYGSSRNDGSRNIVLFRPEHVKCVSKYGDVYRPVSMETTYQNISMKGEKTVTSHIETGVLDDRQVEEVRMNFVVDRQIMNSQKRDNK